MPKLRHGILPLLLAASLGAHAADDVHLNQIQVIGTHNSYHVGFAPSATKLLQAKAPKVLAALDYRHPSLTSQLDDGVRQIELDVYADSQGGLYAHPAITAMIAQAKLPADPPIVADGIMDKPGFKVMHVQDIDQRAVCQPFTACLDEVRAWSKAHPGHVPIFILVETKQGSLKNVEFKSVVPEQFTPAVFDSLDKEIASVFPRNELVTPDDVRGKHATLDEAVQKGGWPTLAKSRGKIVFLMDQRPMEEVYTDGHAALKGRTIFTNAKPGNPDAAFTECNECAKDEIDALVKRGYLVRTRTDDPEQGQARNNDTSRRDAVIDSGAQMLSTDYPAGEAAATGYAVSLPGGTKAARCNPVLKAAGCVDASLEK
ncbi:MAG TPA: phosphatidylinositol-specific phospholipase C1-like protein [Luteibacter sp.]|nr:phosphatidylinositol-specific phospholipase C1-like protein [Luteibacter sp.]